MDVEALITQRSVECFDEAVVGWLAWPTEINPGMVVAGPEIEYLPAEFTTVVDKQAFRCWPLLQNGVERGNHMLATQPLAGDDGQGFAAIDIMIVSRRILVPSASWSATKSMLQP